MMEAGALGVSNELSTNRETKLHCLISCRQHIIFAETDSAQTPNAKEHTLLTCLASFSVPPVLSCPGDLCPPSEAAEVRTTYSRTGLAAVSE
jgi:hypothetical protein